MKYELDIFPDFSTLAFVCEVSRLLYVGSMEKSSNFPCSSYCCWYCSSLYITQFPSRSHSSLNRSISLSQKHLCFVFGGEKKFFLIARTKAKDKLFPMPLSEGRFRTGMDVYNFMYVVYVVECIKMNIFEKFSSSSGPLWKLSAEGELRNNKFHVVVALHSSFYFYNCRITLYSSEYETFLAGRNFILEWDIFFTLPAWAFITRFWFR